MAGAGALLVDDGGETLWETATPLGTRTNNEAEYLALILLLEEARKRGIKDLDVFGDSRLVVKQVAKAWKINEPRLLDLARRAWALCEGMNVRFGWIPREKNARADALSNRALDGPGKKEASLRWVHGGIAVFVEPGGETFAVDLPHRACTCGDFRALGTCRHLEAAAARQGKE